MNIGVVTVRYAKALLAYAKEHGTEEQVYREVKILNDHFTQVADLQRAIENPVLPLEEKLKLLQEAAGGVNVSEELKRFFRLVLDAKRESFLQFMTWSYIDQYHEDKKISLGKLVTAVPSERLVRYLQRIASLYTKGKVELEAQIDPQLIGGFILQLGDYRMDASVAHQLKRVRRQFIAKNRRIV